MANAWLMLAVEGDPHWGGNTGYEDVPEEFYTWDSNVQNARAVGVGDRVVLRNRDVLLGVSVIEEIAEAPGEKLWRRCPACEDKNISRRKTADPPWRCATCGHTFEAPSEGVEAVTAFRARHDAGWTDLWGLMTREELKKWTLYDDRAPHSIQPLDWDGFVSEIVGRLKSGDWSTTPVNDRLRHIGGCFARPTTRIVRRGQGAFRKSLLDRYGSTCAVSGAAPEAALDAAHLYSYAAIGEHHMDGGLLLRSDMHVLFDAGLLAVHPGTHCVYVDASIRDYAVYGSFHGCPLLVSPPAGITRWFAAHWAQHRGT